MSSALLNGVHNILSGVAESIWCDATLYKVERSGTMLGDASQKTRTAVACKAQVDDGRQGRQASSGVQTSGRRVLISTQSLNGVIPETGDEIEVVHPFGQPMKFEIGANTSLDPAFVYYQCDIVD